MIAYLCLVPFLSNLPPHLSSPLRHMPPLEARDLLASSTALYTSPLKRFGTVPGVLGGVASAGRVGAKYIYSQQHMFACTSANTLSRRKT